MLFNITYPSEFYYGELPKEPWDKIIHSYGIDDVIEGKDIDDVAMSFKNVVEVEDVDDGVWVLTRFVGGNEWEEILITEGGKQ